MRAVKSAYEDGMGQEIQLMSKAAGRKYILEEQEKLGMYIYIYIHIHIHTKL